MSRPTDPLRGPRATTAPYTGPHRLDPELAAALATRPAADLTAIPAARALADESVCAEPPPDLDGVTVRRLRVPLPDRPDEPGVPLWLYTPSGRPGPLPALYDIHGGGFVMGSLRATHARSVRLCREVGAVVAAVGYRLAPEHPFPVPLEDCFAGLAWLAAHADGVGVDPDRVALHGQSAGGGLAAALALLTRDRGGPAPCFQYLGTPALDDRLDTAGMRAFCDTPAWDRASAEISWDGYLGPGVRGTDRVSRYAAPARAADLAGLPPAYVTAMQFDPLRDEGIAYALALQDAGVPVELHLFPGTFHGSVGVAHARISRREAAEEVAVLRRALHG
jgi:acetyl esterase/lipase